ncbi:DoxX family protein [Fodinisporobacter ferrooxydans]|uniref:DoxX family protein n=1 Tax=Fodinisporobacter ferrooxydans TaxID=2901836 RepID=A0ABY4CFK7_9BACL|nr:DoxX family protein [Alicyclobacillaceae bacterium MYW30-H2]
MTNIRYAPLALRLILGIIFISHGYSKLATPTGFIQFFTHVGIPVPHVAVPVIGLIELIGGISLLLGFGIRIFASLLVIEMIVAILTAKISMGLVGGYEFELALIAGLISLILSGSGAISIVNGKVKIAE